MLPKKPPGRTGGQPGPYRPNGRSRSTSTEDFAITARLSFRSVLGNGIGPLLEQAGSTTHSEADISGKFDTVEKRG